MRTKINLTLFRPDHPRFNILKSYQEVIDALQWGFQALGFDCTQRVNVIDLHRTNMVFGWIVACQMGALDTLPEDTIIYNGEQFSERDLLNTGIEQVAQRFQVWDYSMANIPNWLACNPRFAPFYAPPCYAPILERIPRIDDPDIDVLYIGSGGSKRNAKLDAVAGTLRRPSVVTLRNVWGDNRDAFIGRSHLMLNISNENPKLKIFEEIRVTYYLANRLPVVCERVEGIHVAEDLGQALIFTSAEELPDVCAYLLDNPYARQQAADVGYATFIRRDVRDLIRRYLELVDVR